jgi:hypothetical protein
MRSQLKDVLEKSTATAKTILKQNRFYAPASQCPATQEATPYLPECYTHNASPSSHE